MRGTAGFALGALGALSPLQSFSECVLRGWVEARWAGEKGWMEVVVAEDKGGPSQARRQAQAI